MAWTDLSDVRCCYDVLGDGPPLLLIPGLGVTRRIWDEAVPGLAEHFSLILPNNRGIGSIAVRSAETLRHYVCDLIELMDYLQIDRTHVMGVSLGGMIARRLATEFPDRVDRLVLASCTDRHTPYLREMTALLGRMIWRMPGTAFRRLVETLGTAPQYFDESVSMIEHRVRAKRNGAGAMQIARQLRCIAAEPGHTSPADSPIAPTLVIAGEYDPLIPACYAREMAARIRGSRFVTVPAGGHNPLQECPEEVVPLIIEFLEGDEEQEAADVPRGTSRPVRLMMGKEPDA